MLLTEGKTKEKYCYTGGDDFPPSNLTCIASQCMAWRWEEESKWVEKDSLTLNPTSEWIGYCGLAGKP